MVRDPEDQALTPRLPRTRRLFLVGAASLVFVALAIAASLFELRHDRDLQHQYESSLMVTHLAFDAESLATRMRTWKELAAGQAAPAARPGAAELPAPPAASLALHEALRAVDVDVNEWNRRLTDALRGDFDAAQSAPMARLRDAVFDLRRALDAPSDILPAAEIAPAQGAAPAGGAGEPVDSAYLAAIGAAQAALLSSVRAGAERTVLGPYTETEVSAAVVVGSSMLALLLGLLAATMMRRAQHESRAAIGVMGELLRTDPLTGITNRRGLDENLPVEMARARRAASPLALAMIDLDYFKRYNSRRGHAGGDALLRAACQAWRKQLRPTDMLVRYGGEEFTLVLPNCAAEQADQLVARLRPLMPDNQTFSAGIAVWDYLESSAQLLRRADEALLTAKKQGRNRTVISGQEDQISLSLPTPT
jgi:diguanylate cyclase (GGDEF)-like protein